MRNCSTSITDGAHYFHPERCPGYGLINVAMLSSLTLQLISLCSLKHYADFGSFENKSIEHTYIARHFWNLVIIISLIIFGYT